MPKRILRCNYLKKAPAAHLANYVNYIGTREGVEKVDSTTALLPATVRQEELIRDILSKIPDADHMHEYYDYCQQPTRENASEFITQALTVCFLMRANPCPSPKWQRKWRTIKEWCGRM